MSALDFPSPAHGQRYACDDEEGFTLSHPEPGRADARYWITTEGRAVDMYVVSPRSGWRIEEGEQAPAAPVEALPPPSPLEAAALAFCAAIRPGGGLPSVADLCEAAATFRAGRGGA